MSLKSFIAGRFASGGVVRDLPTKDDIVPAMMSSRREWVKFPDGRIVEIHGDLFDPRYYAKVERDV